MLAHGRSASVNDVDDAYAESGPDKLACSPPVTPLERQPAGGGAVSGGARSGHDDLDGDDDRMTSLSPVTTRADVTVGESSATAVRAGEDAVGLEKTTGRADEEGGSDAEPENGVATPDRREDEGAAVSSAAEPQPPATRPARSDVGTQAGEDGADPSAAEAARCLRVALRFTQQQAQAAPKPSAKLAMAIQTLAAFVESQAVAAAEEVRRAQAAKRSHRAPTKRSASKPAADGAKASKEDRKKLTPAEKRLLAQVIPEDWVVSDAINIRGGGAIDLSTPRFRRPTKVACATSLPSLTNDGDLEGLSDAAFEIMHRPKEAVEREAHKVLFQPTRGQPARSPRASPAQTGLGGAPVVAPLNLGGSSATQTVATEPDDWEVVDGGRKPGSNRIVLRKKRKRHPEDDCERERKLLRAAVYGKAASTK